MAVRPASLPPELQRSNASPTGNMDNTNPDAIAPAPPKTGVVHEPSAAPNTPSTPTSSGSGSRPVSTAHATAPSSTSSPKPLSPSEHNFNNRFLLLPHEILTLIFHFSEWPSARALRQTCTHMRSSFTVLNTIRKVRAHREALLARDDGSFPAPCYGCVRTLPQGAFPVSAEYQREMGHMYSRTYEWRRCTECLMSSNKMPRGVAYFWANKKYVYCSACGKHRLCFGRFGTFEPTRYCGRCRDIRHVGHLCKKVIKSLQFWVGVMGLLMALFSAMAWRAIAKLWRGDQPYDSPVVSWAFFSACHTLVVQLVYWALVATKHYTRRQTRSRANRFARKLLDSDGTVFETSVEWIAIVVSMCMPFVVREIATVPLLGWSTLSWAAAGVATLLRLCDD